MQDGYSIHFEPGAGAVVFRENNGITESLLVHRLKQNDISLPKGHIEEGESLQQAALREVKEETGYDVTLGELVGRFEYEVLKEEEKKVYWRLIYFFVATANGEAEKVMSEEEVSKVEWLPVEDALKALSYDNDRGMMRDAINLYRKSLK